MPIIGIFCKKTELAMKIQDILFMIIAKENDKHTYEVSLQNLVPEENTEWFYDNIDFLILKETSTKESIFKAEQIWEYEPTMAIICIAKEIEDIFSLLPYPFFHIVREFALETDLKVAIQKMERTFIRTEKWRSFQCKGRTIRVRQKQILYLESQRHEIFLHLLNDNGIKETILLTETLTQLENRFKGRFFSRIHKSFLVNLDHVISLEKERLVLDTNEELYISRHRYATVKLQFESFLRHLDFLS